MKDEFENFELSLIPIVWYDDFIIYGQQILMTIRDNDGAYAWFLQIDDGYSDLPYMCMASMRNTLEDAKTQMEIEIMEFLIREYHGN